MSDRTDTNTVTDPTRGVEVKSIDREATCDLMIPNSVPELYREAILRGDWDNWNPVQAFARHRLASVSSASADYVLVPREPTQAMVEAGEKAGWDHWNSMPAIRAIPASWAAMLAASPEPVPATNQAGEVWTKNEAGVKNGADCYRTINGRRWEWWSEDSSRFKATGVRHRRAPDGQGTFIHPDDEGKATAALATQPATSQEGEV